LKWRFVCRCRVRTNQEREEFEKLPVRVVEMLDMADRQCYLVLPSRNLDAENFICGCAVMRKVFERLGDRSRRPGKIKQDADGPHVHFGGDVQPEELVIRLRRGQLEESILGRHRQADIGSR
jgi:hypothetical protein